MILHIPHSGTVVPESFLKELLLSQDELQREMGLMTDHHCNDLYRFPLAKRIVVPWTRLFCDVERFEDDLKEPMSAYGQGMYYTRTYDARPLRTDTPAGRQAALQVYRAHHAALTAAVDDELQQQGCALIVDCHSFSENALRVSPNREGFPDVCIGTDSFHTPVRYADALANCIRQSGDTVAWNHPFSGSLVPMKHYHKDGRVHSIMIEVNRRLYLCGDSPKRSSGYDRTAQLCRDMLAALAGVNAGKEANGSTTE